MENIKKLLNKEILYKAVVSLRHRSEKEPLSYVNSYVPVVTLSSFLNHNTQVLYGRNGTGKTHIFNCVHEYCEENFLQEKIVPIYIDMRSLEFSRISQDLTHEEFILIFYKKIISEISKQLEEFCNKNSSNILTKLFGKKIVPRSSVIKSSLKQIRKTLNLNNIDETVKSYVKTIRSKHENENGIGISPHIDIPSSIGKISINGKSQGSSLKSEDIELLIKGVHSINISELMKGIDEILDAISAKSLMILVDEWSQIALPLQPVISEMLRRSLCLSNKVSIKFAALKYVTKFSTSIGKIRQRIGLQLGVDISELADLNKIFTYDIDPKAVKTYLTLIMVHHLIEEILNAIREINPEINYLYLYDKNHEFLRYLLSVMFENESAYDYIIKASEGNPRDFLAIFSECCNSTGVDNLPIKSSTSVASAINYFTSIKSDNIDDENTINIFNKIFVHCIRNESKLFLFSNEFCCNFYEICTLWHYRFIHLIEKDIPILQKDGGVVNYCIYSIDFGKVLSLVKTREGEDKATKIFDSIHYFVNKFIKFNPHEEIISRLQKFYKGDNLDQLMNELSIDLKTTYKCNASDICKVEFDNKHIADYILFDSCENV